MGKSKKVKKPREIGDVAIPEGFKDRMREQLGEEADSLLEALNEEPAVSIRLNRRKPFSGALFEGMEPVEWSENGYYLPYRPDFTLNPLFHAGLFYVQEAASMVHEQIVKLLAERLRGEEKGVHLTVLDLCAAPGGKSTAALNSLDDEDVLVANEYDRKRSGILKSNIERWGAPGVIVTSADASAYGEEEEMFDLIIVDAPCSGEGMMRREPVARTQWSEKLVENCARLQKEIVGDVLPALKEGGYIVYSTCTFNREENEDNVNFFIQEYGLKPVELPLRGVDSRGSASVRFMPHLTRGEGLFVAVLQKEGNEAPSDVTRRDEEVYSEVEIKERKYLMSQGVRGIYERLKRNRRINILSAGIAIAEKKGDVQTPVSILVLSSDTRVREGYPAVEVDEATAVSFLRGDSLRFPEGTETGYVAINYKGYPLGLVKNIGSRANNLYPKELRILKR